MEDRAERVNRWSRRSLLQAGSILATAGLLACARRSAPVHTVSGPPVSLEFWLPGRAGDEVPLEPFHTEFVTETPSVTVVQTQLVAKRDVMPKLTTAVVAGTAPDVVRLKEYQVTDLAALQDLLPLGSRVSQDPAVNLRDFTPQSIRGSHFQRQLVGLPDSHQLVVLFWNKNLLARAGLDPEAPPVTWEALRTAAQKVRTQTETRTVVLPWGFQFYEMSTREQAYAWFIEWVWRAGGDVWDANRTRVTLDQPAALAALQFQADLLHADRTAVRPGTPVAELISNVPQGRVGLWMTTAPQALVYSRTAPDLDFGFGHMPRQRQAATQLQHNSLAVLRGTRNPDQAYQLVSYRSRADIQLRWSAEGAWVPVRPALWQEPPFRDDWRWRTIGDLVRHPGNRPKPTVPQWEAVTGKITPHLLTAWRGEVTPAEALRAATREANALLNSRSGR
ncbi:MAG: hypothetical protein CL878_13360 [Dehalococcoidia bacterium]|nr:hypothetical protein [Dehalococcoidia bacterium]